MADTQKSKEPETLRYAVRAGECESETREIADYLQKLGRADATHYLPKDDDDLTRDLCDRKYDVVVFARLDALMSMAWKGEAELDRWRSVGVRVEFAAPSEAETPNAVDLMERVCRSLEAWRAKQRSRQIVAAVLLSLIALIAAGALLFSSPPAF